MRFTQGLAACGLVKGFPGGSVVENLPVDARDTGDTGLIPGWGRSSRGGNGNPPQYSSGKILWAEESGGLQSMGLQRVGYDWVHTWASEDSGLCSWLYSLRLSVPSRGKTKDLTIPCLP